MKKFTLIAAANKTALVATLVAALAGCNLTSTPGVSDANSVQANISTNTSKKLRSDESYLWLEQVEGKQALDWVKHQNKTALDVLKAADNSQRADMYALVYSYLWQQLQ